MSVVRHRGGRIVTLVAAGVAGVFSVTAILSADRSVAILGLGTHLLFTVSIAALIFRNVLRTGPVDPERIFDALSVYVLLGVSWTFLYALTELVTPGAFALGASNLQMANQPGGVADFFYFSFVTLTTLGYGDIVPVAPFARSMAVLEAIVGQIYLTVLVARLVGLHIAR